ncbi:MAG: hypothetical protein GEV06_19730 [Luteitalea sp.]|nr:hypothetical protein [Luteitalea sp.]
MAPRFLFVSWGENPETPITMRIPVDCEARALAQGWTVLVRESDLMPFNAPRVRVDVDHWLENMP